MSVCVSVEGTQRHPFKCLSHSALCSIWSYIDGWTVLDDLEFLHIAKHPLSTETEMKNRSCKVKVQKVLYCEQSILQYFAVSIAINHNTLNPNPCIVIHFQIIDNSQLYFSPATEIKIRWTVQHFNTVSFPILFFFFFRFFSFLSLGWITKRQRLNFLYLHILLAYSL